MSHAMIAENEEDVPMMMMTEDNEGNKNFANGTPPPRRSKVPPDAYDTAEDEATTTGDDDDDELRMLQNSPPNPPPPPPAGVPSPSTPRVQPRLQEDESSRMMDACSNDTTTPDVTGGRRRATNGGGGGGGAGAASYQLTPTIRNTHIEKFATAPGGVGGPVMVSPEENGGSGQERSSEREVSHLLQAPASLPRDIGFRSGPSGAPPTRRSLKSLGSGRRFSGLSPHTEEGGSSSSSKQQQQQSLLEDSHEGQNGEHSGSGRWLMPPHHNRVGSGQQHRGNFVVPDAPTAKVNKPSYVRATSIGLLDVQSIRASTEGIEDPSKASGGGMEEDTMDVFGPVPTGHKSHQQQQQQQQHNPTSSSSEQQHRETSWSSASGNGSMGNMSFHSLDERPMLNGAGTTTTTSSRRAMFASRRSSSVAAAMMRSSSPSPLWGGAGAGGRCGRTPTPPPTGPPPASLLAERPQYQPRREGSFSKIGMVENAEELNAIFAQHRGGDDHDDDDDTTSSFGSAPRNHGNLHRPVPLERSDWSIPSLHLAHNLEGSSTCCSDSIYTGDSYSLRDSFSAQGSLCSLERIDSLEEEFDQELVFASEGAGCENIGGAHDGGEENSRPASAGRVMAPRASPRASPLHHHPHRARSPAGGEARQLRRSASSRARAAKKAAKEKKVIEWLQEIRGNGEDGVAEAASSKFLTRGTAAANRGGGEGGPPLFSAAARKPSAVFVPTTAAGGNAIRIPRPPLHSLKREKSTPGQY